MSAARLKDTAVSGRFKSPAQGRGLFSGLSVLLISVLLFGTLFAPAGYGLPFSSQDFTLWTDAQDSAVIDIQSYGVDHDANNVYFSVSTFAGFNNSALAEGSIDVSIDADQNPTTGVVDDTGIGVDYHAFVTYANGTLEGSLIKAITGESIADLTVSHVAGSYHMQIGVPLEAIAIRVPHAGITPLKSFCDSTLTSRTRFASLTFVTCR